MPVLRKVRDSAHARQLLAELEQSSLTLAEFARERGIDGRSLNMHRVNLESTRSPELRLVEVVPEQAPAPLPRRARYLLWCGDVGIELDEAFDEGVLERLLAVVRGC